MTKYNIIPKNKLIEYKKNKFDISIEEVIKSIEDFKKKEVNLFYFKINENVSYNNEEILITMNYLEKLKR